MNSENDSLKQATIQNPDLIDEGRSKSQVKRERQAIKDLALTLTRLPIKQMQQIPLDEGTRSAIIDLHKMKKGAMKRQLQHINNLMENEDEAAIRTELDRLLLPHQQQTHSHHQLEMWRDKLVAGDDSIITELTDRFANLDRQHLMQLVRNARKELKQEKPPKAARAVFQYIKELQKQD